MLLLPMLLLLLLLLLLPLLFYFCYFGRIQREAQRLRKQLSVRAEEALSEEKTRARCRVEQGRRELMEACAEVRTCSY